MFILYILHFASGKRYVGQTTKSLAMRFAQHKQAAAAGSQLPVHCAWRKHGEPSPFVLAECPSQEELHAAEIRAIKALGTMAPHGYNVGIGGETAPSKTPSVAAKIAAKAKGRLHSDETRANLSDGLRARWLSPEYRAAVSAGQQAALTDERRAFLSACSKAFWEKRKAEGWVMPESQRKKIAAKVISDDARAKMSASAKKKIVSEEARKNMSAAMAGRVVGPYSEERKKNAAAGVKAAWQDPEKRARMMAARKTAWETRRNMKAK